MDPITQQISDLTDRVVTLEGTVASMHETLKQQGLWFDEIRRTMLEVPKLAGAPVTNTPTASGYIPVTLNGIRTYLMTGS